MSSLQTGPLAPPLGVAVRNPDPIPALKLNLAPVATGPSPFPITASAPTPMPEPVATPVRRDLPPAADLS